MANFDLSGVEFVKKAEVVSPLTGASILILADALILNQDPHICL